MSSPQTTNNFYQILNVSKDATDKEIKRAYELAIQTYNANSLATYSLFSEEESDEILRNITKAYITLNDPITRAQYDKEIEEYTSKSLEDTEDKTSHGPVSQPTGQPPSNIQNKDIFKQKNINEEMTNLEEVLKQNDIDEGITNLTEELYLSGAESISTVSLNDTKESSKETDLSAEPAPIEPTPASTETIQLSGSSKYFEDDFSTTSLAQRLEARLNIRSDNREVLNRKNKNTQKIVSEFLSTVTEYNGQVLKQIRELKSINLEEIAEETCVRKVYLIAIEEEDYLKLPDIPIYIKSFLSNYARCLGLPSEKVIEDYMSIYKERSH